VRANRNIKKAQKSLSWAGTIQFFLADGEIATEVVQAFVIRAVLHSVTQWYGSRKTAKGSPSPGGEGRGEGDRRVQISTTAHGNESRVVLSIESFRWGRGG
jgi:hypothetical protein